VDNIVGVIDVECDAGRWGWIARDPLIDESIGQADDVAQARGVLQPRKGG
jgi:hypothetical protein